MEQQIVLYILGMATMFYAIMTWVFCNRRNRLSWLVAVLMGMTGAQCVKDLVFMVNGLYAADYYWEVMTAMDIVVVPLYAMILTELVQPDSVSVRRVLLHEMPFVALIAAYIISGSQAVFSVLTAWTVAYGTYYLVWTHFGIARYNLKLKEMLSFTDDVDLSWLRRILFIFYVVLGLWALDSFVLSVNTKLLGTESLYLVSSVAIWMVISYFLYRHQNMLQQLNLRQEAAVVQETPEEEATPAAAIDELGDRIGRLFSEKQIYLNPNLKISDVAAAVGSNRTYVSAYFNRQAERTFYDYVNGHRVDHACRLLAESDESVMSVALKSGYNSPQSFIRVFTKVKGMSPRAYRQSLKG